MSRCPGATSPASGSSLRAAPVRTRDDLQEVAVGREEVDAAAAVVRVDLARPGLTRIGPVRHLLFLDAAEDLVELVFAHEEGVVLAGDGAGRGREVEAEPV